MKPHIPPELAYSVEAIESMPFVHGKVWVESRGNYSRVRLNIRVDLPSKGPVFDIRETEPIAIYIIHDLPFLPPQVSPEREDFPSVPHLTRAPGKKISTICLTRQSEVDWWFGKTLEDVVLQTYRWLTDAAAGELVKSDDPFEPLIVDAGNPAVELDFNKAREEAGKHGGIWDTTACQVAVPNQSKVRLIIGPGDVPTRLWYQTNIQNTPWIDVPEDINGVLKLAADIGLDPRKVRYWIEKGGERNNRVLTVFGVKRPKLVMGQAGAEEWVGFDFHLQANNKEWTTTSHLVLRRFDQDLARQVSGLGEIKEPKKILVLGAGAFGSSVCELLARSGIAHLIIVDSDTLRPHNLARHVLTGQDIGQSKALAVAARLNDIFAEEQVATGIFSNNILSLSDEKLKELMSGVTCVLDCSASVAVQYRLAAINDRPVPLVCAFQINAGEGTVVLVEGAICRGRSDAIEAAMIMKERKDPVVAGWLTEKTAPLALGGGCSSASARIPDARVKVGAAWVADSMINLLAGSRWPEKPVYGILKNTAGANPTISTEWKHVDVEQVTEASGGWRVFVLKSAIDDLNRFAQAAEKTETGGILVGRVNRQLKTFYVCEAWPAPPDSNFSSVGFTRGRRKLANKLALLEADSGDNLTYVGEWHAHPQICGVGMSARDSETANEMAEKLTRDRIPALCVITNRSCYDIHVVENLQIEEK